MKTVLYILTSFVSALLFTAPLSGAENPAVYEEATARWERDAAFSLYGKRAVSGVICPDRNCIEDCFVSLCSLPALKGLQSLEREALDAVNSSLKFNARTAETAVALKILRKLQNFAFPCSSSGYEELEASLSCIPFSENYGSGCGLVPSGIPAELSVFTVNTAVSVNVRSGKVKAFRRTSYVNEGRTGAINCTGFLWDREYGDKYRLFLYLRDDGAHAGSLHKKLHLFHPSFLFITFFRKLFSYFRHHRIRFININLYTGAVS